MPNTRQNLRGKWLPLLLAQPCQLCSCLLASFVLFGSLADAVAKEEDSNAAYDDFTETIAAAAGL